MSISRFCKTCSRTQPADLFGQKKDGTAYLTCGPCRNELRERYTGTTSTHIPRARRIRNTKAELLANFNEVDDLDVLTHFLTLIRTVREAQSGILVALLPRTAASPPNGIADIAASAASVPHAISAISLPTPCPQA